jgi:hypothetical protein
MEDINHFSIALYGTTINVSRKPLYDVAHTVEYIIVGKHQQQLLDHIFNRKEGCIRHSPSFNKFYHPGLIHFKDSISYKHTNDESDPNDETYKPFEEENKFTLTTVIPQSESQTIIEIAEPYITSDGYYRDPISNQLKLRFRYRKTKLRKECTFDGQQAITEASKDLAWCYENALMTGIIYKNIAIPTLGADVGFPREKAAPIALTEITDFIRAFHPHTYNRIELVVKKWSEFTAYKKFLIDCWIEPCLLILAHTDKDHFLYHVPREIIDFILLLMHVVTIQQKREIS